MTALTEGSRPAQRRRLAERPRFLIARELPARLKLKRLSHLSSRKMIHVAMTTTPLAEWWVVSDREFIKDLLEEAVQRRSWLSARNLRLGHLALLEPPPLSCLPPAEAMFNSVAWADARECWLPLPEMMEVLAAPNRHDLIIGGMVDHHSQTLTVYRGDFGRVTVPLSIFKPSGDGTVPNPKDFGVSDYGHGIRLGSYESSADAIFYEGDPAYRKALRARRRNEEKTFGACLRRLRIQRRLLQTDFRPLAARTIARIENNKVGKPHGKTLSIIASRLDVDPDAIEMY
jgi:hypothetical protein